MATRRRMRPMRPIDQRSAAEAFSFPGADPREWISYGTVSDDDPCVTFDPDHGPLVAVDLQPSKVPVVCRVGARFAGNGESEYFPFVAGDEVLVAIPGGNERGGCVIISRLTNSIDKFPADSIAGQDPTTNAFAFERHRTPFVKEVAGPMLMRQATTGALLSIDTKGTVTLRDGTKNVLQMLPDVFGFQDANGEFLMQLDMSGGRYSLTVKDASFTISSSKASPPTSAINVPGKLILSSGTNPAAEHVVTTEAVVNIIANVLGALGLAIAPLPGPLSGAALAAVFNLPASAATIATGLGTAATAPLLPALSAAISAAFGGAQQKPPGVPGVGQAAPGIGCAALLAG